MAKSDMPEKKQRAVPEIVAEGVFSSEKREDIWAIIIALSVLILSVVFPDQIHQFFSNALYLF